MFRFPYCICYLKNLSLNTSIFYNLILNKILPNINIKYKNYFYFKAYSAILKNNIKESHHYYENFYFKNKFSKLIKHIDLYFKKKKIDYSIIIVPQYFDLKLSKSRNKYIKFYRELKNPNVIDLTEEILKLNNWNKYYFIDKYGGHLNKFGNKILSNIINKKLS